MPREIVIGPQNNPIIHPATGVPLGPNYTPDGSLGGTADKVDQRHQLDADGWASSGRWANVKSSNVEAIKYDLPINVLEVSFKGGGTYSYYGVSYQTAKDMFNYHSMGKFVHKYLKGRYPYRRHGQ